MQWNHKHTPHQSIQQPALLALPTPYQRVLAHAAQERLINLAPALQLAFLKAIAGKPHDQGWLATFCYAKSAGSFREVLIKHLQESQALPMETLQHIRWPEMLHAERFAIARALNQST